MSEESNSTSHKREEGAEKDHIQRIQSEERKKEEKEINGKDFQPYKEVVIMKNQKIVILIMN